MLENLLTVAEVAAILGRSPQWVTRLIYDGSLPVVRLPGMPAPTRSRGRKDFRIRAEDVRALIDRSTTRATPRPVEGPKPRVSRKASAATSPVPGLSCWDGKSRIKW